MNISCIKYLIRTFVLLLLLAVMHTDIRAQQEQQFNRFQYHKFRWQAFHTTAFHVYFPLEYDSLCAFVVRELPFAMKKVKHNMGTNLMKEPSIVIYPSIDQSYESNIGLYEAEPYPFPTFMKTGSRHVLAFDGSYDNLKDQLYEAVARAVWDAQMKEDNSNPLTGGTPIVEDEIPFWFREGAIRYYAHKWPIHAEDALKRSYKDNNFQSWEASISYQPRLSGQAFCYFLATQYYPQAVLQLCNQIKKKNLARSVRLITKKPLDSLFRQCHSFYKQRFEGTGSKNADTADDKPFEAIERKSGIVKDVQLSPDNNYIAYTVTSKNKRSTYIANGQTNSTEKISTYKLPPWIDDHSKDSYPLIKWKEPNNSLITLMPFKGKQIVKSYTVTGSNIDEDELIGIDGIMQYEPLQNGNYLLSAYRKGQSDLVHYNRNKAKYTVITSDTYDDGKFAFTQRNVADIPSELHFVSDRPATKQVNPWDSIKIRQGIYKVANKDIQPFVIDSVDYIQWDKPFVLPGKRLLLTHTKDGTERFALFNNLRQNQYITLSDYQPIQIIQNSNQVITYKVDKDSVDIHKEALDSWLKPNAEQEPVPWLKDYMARKAAEAREDSILRAAQDQPASFSEGILKPKNAKELAKRREDSISKSLAFIPKKIKPYILQLHSAYFTAKINNDYYINRYQPYQAYQGQFKFPEVGGMIQGGFTDLLENHHFNIAFRLPAGTEGSDFLVRYQNTTKKLDWGLAYFRKAEMLKPDPLRDWVDETGKAYPDLAKVKTHYYEATVSYPLSYYLSLGVTTAIRQDRTIFLATENYSLKFADFKSLWWISTPALTYNKLKPTVPFLYKGLKAKLMLDVFKAFTQKEEALLGSGIQISHYHPLYKYITLETKLKVGYSIGKSRVLYNLGGTDNNVVPKIDSTVYFSQTAPYAFQTLVTPFRGHLQNSLYGDQYALVNADIYFPIFQTLVPIETPLQFINLLQPGIFSDAGTAKEDWNIAGVSKGILWSYGLSLRTSLAGYPLRLDVAWPGTFDKKPVWYFSLNLK